MQERLDVPGVKGILTYIFCFDRLVWELASLAQITILSPGTPCCMQKQSTTYVGMITIHLHELSNRN